MGKDLALSVILTAEISFDIFLSLYLLDPITILSPHPFCGHQKLNGEVRTS